MARTAVDGTWSQKLTRVGGCDKFKLHYVTYKDTDGQPKEWHGVHLKTGTGQEADDDAGEERVVCVVKGHVRNQEEPFILLLATYMPALNRTCLTLPSGWKRRSEHTNWKQIVSNILFDTTGERVHVKSATATAKSIGCPHLAPERVKVVTAAVGRIGPLQRLLFARPPCGFHRGPRSSISSDNAIFPPVRAGVRSRSTCAPCTPHHHPPASEPHMLGRRLLRVAATPLGSPESLFSNRPPLQAHPTAAHRLCFLPMSGARAALAALRASFDEVDAEVELLVHALSIEVDPPAADLDPGLPGIFLAIAGAVAGAAVTLACTRGRRGSRPRRGGGAPWHSKAFKQEVTPRVEAMRTWLGDARNGMHQPLEHQPPQAR